MTSTNRTEQDAPRLINGVPEGMLEHGLADDFHALCCVVGFEEARRRMAEIINYEAGGRHHHEQ